MKLGFVISMYDEIDTVKSTLINLKKLDCVTIVIQSDPGEEKLILDSNLCDKYEMMSDLAGNRQNYEKIIEEKKEGKGEIIGPIALTRNFNRGFSLIKDFELDYIIALTGDTKITSLKGISNIVKNMKKHNKRVGGTRTIGFTQYDELGNYTRFQHREIMDIMPQFFIVNSKDVKNGLFSNTKRTNKFTTEQCFGDEIIRYCKENNLKFIDEFYRICDYAYPRFIEGLEYNPEQLSKMPEVLEKFINWIRYQNGKTVNQIITYFFKIIENSIDKK
jgi:hypothetical protein